MAGNTQAAPLEMGDMNRTVTIKLDKLFVENDRRKLNFVVRNTIENVFAGLTDLERVVKALDAENDVSVYGGTPGQVGFTVQYFKSNLSVHGGGNNTHAYSHTTTYKGMAKIEEMTYPYFIKTSTSMDINGQRSMASISATSLADRGDGTVLVMMVSNEKVPSFCDSVGGLFCIMPCCLLCIPCLKNMYEAQIDTLGSQILNAYKNYLSIASVETTSFYGRSAGPATTFTIAKPVELVSFRPIVTTVESVAAPASSSSGDLVAQLENLKRLFDQGILDQQQYEAAKNRVISGP